MTTTPLTEIHKLAPTALLDLFVLDLTALGGSVYRFHAGTNQVGSSIVWQGNTYSPFPVVAEGFEWSGKGVLARPKLRVAALDGVIGNQVRLHEDLVGATVLVKRVFARHLDAINFPGNANPNADPTAQYPDDPWIIERKTVETSDVIEFELVSPLDIENAKIPKRRVQANVCVWNDATICIYSTPAGTCDHTLNGPNGCKVKWGASAELPFGGFPGTARVR